MTVESIPAVDDAAADLSATDTAARPARGSATQVLQPWLLAQAVNVNRHAGALRPFQREEFGTTAAAPSEGHLQAVNALMGTLRKELLRLTRRVSDQAQRAVQDPSSRSLARTVLQKEHAHRWVQGIERIWDFYFELFGQRQGRYADWLLSCDRIAADCYQVAFSGIGTARSIPAPPPFCYMRTGFAPATWRRGIPMKRLGQQLNPFPLIQLPYHRLVNPWTLAAILHEVSHNLQDDLGLGKAVPRTMGRALLAAGIPPEVVRVWVRWNREIFGDLSGVLLGGPSVLGSVLDVIGRGPDTVLAFNPDGVHPPPYLRALINFELVRRMGFEDIAKAQRTAWQRIYPNPMGGTLPKPLLASFDHANRVVVDALCYRPFKSLGERSLAQVLRFEPKDQTMIEEAARRLAAGNDPGIISARYLIGATRHALDTRLARPEVLARNFYLELVRR